MGELRLEVSEFENLTRWRWALAVPVALGRAIGIGPLLGALVDAAAGDTQAAGRASHALQEMAAEPDWSALAGVLSRILGGERDPGLAEQVEDPTDKAVVVTMLGHIGNG